jgi:hypothetical protein
MKCIDKLDCRHTQMILLDLAIVAKVVHDHSDKYQLFKRQCFWYSDVIIGVLQENFPRIQVDPSLVAEMGGRLFGGGSLGRINTQATSNRSAKVIKPALTCVVVPNPRPEESRLFIMIG